MVKQLALPVEPELKFVVICPACGEVVAVIPVEGGDWHAAECWSYVAQKTHEKECAGR